MKKLLVIVCVIVVIGIVTAVAMDRKYVSGTWRYKLTVVVETPEGIKTGSAIREVRAQRQPTILRGGGLTTKHSVRGEAVVVDLGKRGVLFAIMGINGSYEIVYEAFPRGGISIDEEIKWRSQSHREYGDKKVVLDPKKHRDYPKLVTFTDINDPKTVKAVNRNKLYEVFGEGVKLKEIYIQMTDEPVTWGIEEKIKWLKKIHGNYLHGKFTSRNAPLGLHSGHFKRGEK